MTEEEITISTEELLATEHKSIEGIKKEPLLKRLFPKKEPKPKKEPLLKRLFPKKEPKPKKEPLLKRLFPKKEPKPKIFCEDCKKRVCTMSVKGIEYEQGFLCSHCTAYYQKRIVERRKEEEKSVNKQ